MSITQGQQLVRDYASQFETLLGRLDNYDESMMLNQFIWGLQQELARSVSLQYPKSIAQAVSLAETTELAVKASRRPARKQAQVALDRKAQLRQIGAEDFGVVDRGVVEAKEVEGWGILVGADGDLVEEEEEKVEIPVLILWHVTGAGCMAIWPMTVLVPVSSRRHWEVATPALPVEHSPNPAKRPKRTWQRSPGAVRGPQCAV